MAVLKEYISRVSVYIQTLSPLYFVGTPTSPNKLLELHSNTHKHYCIYMACSTYREKKSCMQDFGGEISGKEMT